MAKIRPGDSQRREQQRGFAVSPPGFEDLVEAELLGLGIDARRVEGGVEFSGRWRDVYRVNLRSRVASRVLVRVAEFGAETFSALEAGLAGIPWEEWLPPNTALSVKVAKRATRLYHTGKVAESAYQVVAGAVGARQPKEGEAGLALYLRVQGPGVTVSLDTSGEHLHRRGYRTETGPAPLRENLAAGLVLRSGWAAEEPLLDPFCGTGTLAIEAVLLALRIPPGWWRSFSFERLPSFDRKTWAMVREKAGAEIQRVLPAPVYASDRDSRAIESAVRAAQRAGIGDHLQVAVSAVHELAAPEPSGLVVANPPYGLRLGGETGAYRALGNALRGPFGRWRWGVVVANRQVEKVSGLTPRERHPFRNGGLKLWFAAGGPENP